MKICVTGGSGAIGSFLCESLLKEGNHVVCVDNLLTGDIENIKNLKENKLFKFFRNDICENNVFKNVCNVLNIKKFDQIYNLASPASPIHYQRNSIETIEANTIGVMNVLKEAIRTNCDILHTSTSEIYGEPLVHPQKETYYGNVNIVGPRSCYDESKRCSETIIMSYKEKYDLNVRIVRIFNCFSENLASNDGRVISNFIAQTLRNLDVTIYGDGTQTRSFCYVDDMINGLKLMMNNKSNFVGPINLGNPNEISIIDLAKKVINMTNSKSKIIFNKLPKNDPARRCPDISLAKEKLLWEPKTSLEEGLEKVINSFKKRVNRK